MFLWLSSVPPGKYQDITDKQQLLPYKCQDSVDQATTLFIYFFHSIFLSTEQQNLLHHIIRFVTYEFHLV